MTDAELIAGAHSWRATPWNYSALAGLLLKSDGSGMLLFGHGQTIYAVILCAWEIPTPGILRLTYHDSPPHQFFKGFTPTEENRVKELTYTLTRGEVLGVEDVVARPYKFGWTLELSGSAWPDGLVFPRPVPTVFYGYQQALSDEDTHTLEG
jgi:hypothetical protein